MKKRKKSTNPPIPKEVQAAALAMKAHFQAQEDMQRTEVGRRALELRNRAHTHSASGNQDLAHPLFIEAASLYAPNDPSAGAAACWYDLAESWARLRDEREKENLVEAERLFRLSLASPARQLDTLRMARSHDGLGRALRRIADIVDDSNHRTALEEESLREHRRAWALVSGLAILNKTAGVSYLANLGNALARRGHHAEAISCYEQSIANIESIVAGNGNPSALLELAAPDQPLLPSIRLHFAQMLSGINATGEHTTRIIALVDKVIAEGDRRQATRAQLVKLHALSPTSQTSQIAAAAREIDSRYLLLAELPGVVSLLFSCQQRDLALPMAREGVQRALKLRQDALADHAADEAAESAQQMGRLEAELWLAQDHPVKAFLALENVSALRYYDAVKDWGWSHRDPVARMLSKRCGELSRMAMALDEVAAFVIQLPGDQQSDALRRIAIDDYRDLSSYFEVAREHTSPAAFLRETSQRLLVEVRRLNSIASSREPTNSRERLQCDAHLEIDELRQLLGEHPGTVMLRLHWSHTLLAAAVWLENGALVGKAKTIHVREDAIAPGLYLTRFADDHEPYHGPRMAEVLEGLDLGEVLPEPAAGPSGGLILLPSTYASLIPWAAAGPAGTTMLDRFESIVWLPNLTPLRMRQMNFRHRAGTVIVCPGRSQRKPTAMHAVAFSRLAPGERMLSDGEAEIGNVEAHAATADVVCFYAHGSYERMEPGHIRLANGTTLDVGQFGHVFLNCERVELWACRSGVNRSTSVLTPDFVDEAFGLDIAFHRGGARSTIGTLWTVIEAVTAKLCARYREELASGHPAPTALARAQRWWRDEALPQVHRLLHSGDLDVAWKAIVELLDVDDEGDMAAVLGKTLSGSEHTPDSVWAALSPPEAWAGYRFVGVCERRPQGEDIPEHIELTPEEEAELEALINERDGVIRPNPDQKLLADLLGHYEWLDAGHSPTAARALAVARLYLDKREGRRSHHIYRALAWVHEALGAGIGARDERRQLRVEAAYLWLELARGEVAPALLGLFPAHVGSRRMLEDMVGAGKSDGPVFEAWLWLLTQARPLIPDTRFTNGVLRWFRKAWRAACNIPRASYEGIRARAVAADLLLSIVRAPRDLLETIAREYDDIEVLTPEITRVCMHMQATIAELLARHDVHDYPEPDFYWLGHRHFQFVLRRASMVAEATQSPEAQQYFRELISSVIGQLEADFWGYPSDFSGFWRTTGTPGHPWHAIVGRYNADRLRVREESQAVVHFLATLHMGCDLRLGPLSSASRLLARESRNNATFPWDVVWRRQHILGLLEESTSLPVDMSPYVHSTDWVLSVRHDHPEDIVGWEIGSRVRAWGRNSASFTAAFEAERLLCALDRQAIESAPDFVDTLVAENALTLPERFVDVDPKRSSARALFPMIRLEAAERTILEMPPGVAVLGLSSGMLELSLGVTWRDGGGLHTRSVVVENLGFEVRALMARMFEYGDFDYGNQVGVSARRAEPWSQICSLLDPQLGAILSDIPRGTMLCVLAPGFLRPLPLLALSHGGRLLRDDFVVALVPHLGFGQSSRISSDPRSGNYTVCVLGEEHEWGETCFGEAAVRTLRSYFPIRAAAEATDPIAIETISEVDVIHRHMEAAEVLRFYGSPSFPDLGHETSVLGLRGGRKMRAFNISGMRFPRCECVELWAATNMTGQYRMIVSADHDRIPGLAWNFLAAGAAGVVDLAWPVHDLVLALVCESFGIIRQVAPQPGASALVEALREVDRLLEMWDRQITANHSIEAALDWIDTARELRMAKLGRDSRHVRRFSALAEAPSVALGSARDLVECCCRPEQLASFRWWGSPMPGLL